MLKLSKEDSGLKPITGIWRMMVDVSNYSSEGAYW